MFIKQLDFHNKRMAILIIILTEKEKKLTSFFAIKIRAELITPRNEHSSASTLHRSSRTKIERKTVQLILITEKKRSSFFGCFSSWHDVVGLRTHPPVAPRDSAWASHHLIRHMTWFVTPYLTRRFDNFIA
jgi:hypothetical protein